MGKSILMSIQPKWVALILNGEKTIEIRKRFPKDYVGWVYIYCTKNIGKHGENQLLNFFKGNEYFIGRDIDNYDPNDICYLGQNGKVVAKLWCDKVELIEYCGMCYMVGDIANTNRVANQSCLDFTDMKRYLGNKNGYAIHISKLEVFDKPKELKELKTRYYPQFANMKKNTIHYELVSANKAPQSYMFVEGE